MIRLAIKEDLEQIESFDEFGGNRADEIVQKRLKVYILENKIIGYIATIGDSCLCGHPYIKFLRVHSAYRRQGIGSKLLLTAEQKYVEQKLFISTEKNNIPMLNLIKKRGYILSGFLSGLNDDDSDEVYFYKHIT